MTGLNIYGGKKSARDPVFIMCFVSVCRTESVAEKMLTNWFTFLLYKFLKVTLLLSPLNLFLALVDESMSTHCWFALALERFSMFKTTCSSDFI